MAVNEKTSARVAKIAAKAMKDPASVTKAEVKSMAASVLTQAPDKPKKAAAKKTAKKPAKKAAKKPAARKTAAKKPAKRTPRR